MFDVLLYIVPSHSDGSGSYSYNSNDGGGAATDAESVDLEDPEYEEYCKIVATMRAAARADSLQCKICADPLELTLGTSSSHLPNTLAPQVLINPENHITSHKVDSHPLHIVPADFR
jgi:hypothetical protein